MAFLQLRSDNPNISFVIQKNPSAPMIAKQIRKGVAFGYYDDDNNYNIFFQDAVDEISFGKGEEFEYLDASRYDSPIFLFSVVREFFGTALSRQTEKDVPGCHEIFLPNYHVARGRYMSIMSSFSPRFCLTVGEGGVTFSVKNGTVHELLNYAYACSTLNIFFGHGPMFFDASIAKRLAVAVNIVGASYLPRYLAKMVAVRAKCFNDVKEELSRWPGHTFEPDAEATSQEARVAAVAKYILPNKSIVDVGAGDGQFLFLSNRLDKGLQYIAVDRDEKCQEILARKKAKYDKLSVAPSYVTSMASGEYVAIMSEVLEHNEKNEATQILMRALLDKKCIRIVVTMPNHAFNVNFPNPDAFRHEDHQFELNQEEFREFIGKAVAAAGGMVASDTDLEVNFGGIGDVVDGEPVSQLAVIDKKVKL